METLFAVLNAVYPMSQGLINHLTAILQAEELKAGQVLLKAGQPSRKVYFIEKGLFRCFYFKNNKEITCWFMKEYDVMYSVRSFLSQKPGYENIQAIEDSLVHSITYDQLQEIYQLYPEFNIIGRVLTEKYYMASEDRSYATKMQHAIDRYKELLETDLLLFQRVPLMHLASYLGMTPTRLSMVRKKNK